MIEALARRAVTIVNEGGQLPLSAGVRFFQLLIILDDKHWRIDIEQFFKITGIVQYPQNGGVSLPFHIEKYMRSMRVASNAITKLMSQPAQ